MQENTAENRLKRTLFCVEATSFETQALWCDHAEGSDWRPDWVKTPLTWEQMDGWCVTVGKIGKRPVCISITWVKIDGCLIAFYEGCSQVVDYVQVEKWLDKHFKGTYDGGTRRATCDAMNFGHCLSAIKEHNQNKNQ